MPTVSVLLNSYNQADFVRESVESVLAQTFEDYELIVTDNGSTDRTPEILRAYEHHPNVRLVLHKQNAGVSRRFNEAVAMARGEFVTFLYSDDLYLPNKLERQVSLLRSQPADYGVVYGPAEGLNQLTGRRWRHRSVGASGWVLRDLLQNHERGQIDMISPLMRRVCLIENPFFEDIFAEGEAIYYRIALGWKFLFIDEPLVVLRDHGANAGKAIERNAEMSAQALDRLPLHPQFPKSLRETLRRYRARLLRNQGWQSVRVGGNMRWARKCFSEALQTDWRAAIHPRLIVGLGMSFAPIPIRSVLNRWANALLRVPENARYVEDFGGAGARSQS